MCLSKGDPHEHPTLLHARFAARIRNGRCVLRLRAGCSRDLPLWTRVQLRKLRVLRGARLCGPEHVTVAVRPWAMRCARAQGACGRMEFHV